MKSLAVIGLLATAAVLLSLTFTSHQQDPTEEIFNLYKLKYGKIYSPEENKYRFIVFQNSYKQMARHNTQRLGWAMGLNQFSDVSQEEFVKNYLGELPPVAANMDYDKSITVGAVDWVARGVITSVKNQGSCGSCWAFAATAVHESYQVLKNKRDVSINLAPQQLVDCSTGNPYNNGGCGGGYASHGIEYIKDNGQTTEEAYPYKAVNQNCSIATGSYKINGVAEVTGCANM